MPSISALPLAPSSKKLMPLWQRVQNVKFHLSLFLGLLLLVFHALIITTSLSTASSIPVRTHTVVVWRGAQKITQHISIFGAFKTRQVQTLKNHSAYNTHLSGSHESADLICVDFTNNIDSNLNAALSSTLVKSFDGQDLGASIVTGFHDANQVNDLSLPEVIEVVSICDDHVVNMTGSPMVESNFERALCFDRLNDQFSHSAD
jgi:hypothetical protein